MMKKVLSTFVLILFVISLFAAVTLHHSNVKSYPTVTITNDATVALDDYFVLNEDIILSDSVTINDTLSDDGGNTWSLINGPAHGIIAFNADGTFSYTPGLNYNGADQFTYQLCDVDGDCDTAVVFLTINPVNDAPVALNDSATINEDTPITIDVVTNDSDIDGNLDFNSMSITVAPLHGLTTIDNLNGSITYTPSLNYYGTDHFTYSINDDGTPLPAISATATVTIHITPVNDAGLPFANNDYAYTTSYTPITINVLYNDYFGDVPCTCAITATNGTHGTTTINNNSTPNNPLDDKVVYTPNTSYNGPDHFTYTIQDIDGETATATVFVDVTSMYAPALTAPVNGATDQMPNAFLSWSAVPGAFHYKVQISKDSIFTNPVYYTSTLTALNSVNLNFNTSYYWRVKAYGVSDSSGWSDFKRFKVLKTVKIIKPLNGTQDRPVSLYFKWNAVTGIIRYEYQIDSSTSFTSPLLVMGNIASSKIETYSKNVAFNTNLYLRMRALHATDTSDWSDLLNFKTINSFALLKPLNNSSNLTPVEKLEWVCAGSNQYEYALSTDSLFTNAIYTTIDTTHRVIIGADTTIVDTPDTLKFGQTYYWKVRGVNNFGTSDWSATWKYNTIGTVSLVSPANNEVNVSTLTQFKWTAIANIGHYNLELDTSNTFDNPTYFTFGKTLTSYTLTNQLSPFTTYYWHMRAITSADSSDWTATRKFTTAYPYSINEISDLNDISIYPNPSSTGKVSVLIPASAAGMMNISVVNMVGQIIYNDVFRLNPGDNLYTLNLQGKDNGIYFIRLQSDDNTVSRKIILNR